MQLEFNLVMLPRKAKSDSTWCITAEPSMETPAGVPLAVCLVRADVTRSTAGLREKQVNILGAVFH